MGGGARNKLRPHWTCSPFVDRGLLGVDIINITAPGIYMRKHCYQNVKVARNFGQDLWIIILLDRLCVLTFLPEFSFKEQTSKTEYVLRWYSVPVPIIFRVAFC